MASKVNDSTVDKTPMTRMDKKLAKIRSGDYRSGDFIIADAKDSDMGSGVTGTGFDRAAGGAPRRRSRQEFLTQITDIIRQDIVDIMLVSASNLELLVEKQVFKNSEVQAAIRANDTTDCWAGVRHGCYGSKPSVPFRTANLDSVKKITDLGLYSITFLNNLEADVAAQKEFAEFRKEAASVGLRYFYEVFNPNVECGLTRPQIGEFLNDSILRSLAGVMRDERPEFLKIPFNGPAAVEELASYDSELVVGVLGGGAGTVRDTFELIHQSERYGARVALFGRKINLAEAPLEIIRLMKEVANGAVTPREAVRAYHAALQKANIQPTRSRDEDLQITEDVLVPGAVDKAA
jgi:hypothetical protein